MARSFALDIASATTVSTASSAAAVPLGVGHVGPIVLLFVDERGADADDEQHDGQLDDRQDGVGRRALADADDEDDGDRRS